VGEGGFRYGTELVDSRPTSRELMQHSVYSETTRLDQTKIMSENYTQTTRRRFIYIHVAQHIHASGIPRGRARDPTPGAGRRLYCSPQAGMPICCDITNTRAKSPASPSPNSQTPSHKGVLAGNGGCIWISRLSTGDCVLASSVIPLSTSKFQDSSPNQLCEAISHNEATSSHHPNDPRFAEDCMHAKQDPRCWEP
jgi:hypothetical protein